ncbi:outer membrane protein [Ketogulonicigenium vulgare]|uniref:outer membrane protein n=1 Tax=Ketogulonicigenium vulgare TaxID=92945 RepID=UPI0023595B9E|nr:outer membrane beta-barrel protein [Ketogulonicigenium vulgare]
MRYLVSTAIIASVFGATAATAGGLAAPTIEAPVAVVVAQPVAPMAWAGGYVGANVNYGSSEFDATLSIEGLGSETVTLAEPDGVNYAVRGGYDWQLNNWILGLGAEYNFGEYSDTILGGGADLNVTDVATVYFKAGYAFSDATAVYGLIGHTWATGEIEVAGETFEEDLKDWTIGLGVEHRFNRNWSVYGEYAYTDFGTFFSETEFDETLDIDADLGQFKIGVNYRF